MKSLAARGAVAGALCALVAAALHLLDPTLLGAEWLARDFFTRLVAARRTPDTRIVLVTVNEETTRVLDQAGYGRPPYSRELYASAVAELRRAGARVIAFDILFAEENINDPEGDRAFAASMRGAPVILAAQTEPLGGGEAAGAPPTSADYAAKLWRVGGEMPPPFRLVPPHPSFGTAEGIGTIHLARSENSSAFHNYSIAHRVGGGAAVPSLAAEIARVVRGAARGVTFESRAAMFAGLRIPLDEEKRMTLRWSGEGDLPYLSYDFHKLLAAALAHDDPQAIDATHQQFHAQFRDKIVLIGYTAAGLHDIRANPLSPIAPGLILHATATDNLINGDFARLAPTSVTVAILIFATIAFGAVVYSIRSQIAAGIVFLLALAATAGAVWLLLRSGVIVPTVAAAGGLLLTYISITAAKLLTEQEQTAMLKTTFGRYVSPQILDHILAHPEKVRLGGERRELTILFSDIRGFTSISEASEPEEVVEMLNEYLTRMVEILLAHGGTLDKFIGDAVMGFWNAPAPDPDHPRHAVACAIEMVEETALLRERWEREGKPALRIGIGVNTGEAVVGNIGAEKVFGYTVIGDAVNLASRLEGKNKDYGTEIIVSEFTLARMGEGFGAVYLDDVKVKGKEKAVRIYKVEGRGSVRPSENQ